MELLTSIAANQLKAKMVISSVLPRNWHQNVNINQQIKDFNKMLAKLACDEKIYFCDNYVYFEKEKDEANGMLYKPAERSGIHLNKKGQEKLAEALMSTLFWSLCHISQNKKWKRHGEEKEYGRWILISLQLKYTRVSFKKNGNYGKWKRKNMMMSEYGGISLKET